ncbi:MAG: hypothetical protein AB1625_02365 [Acidobacteriota bacterium]
MASVPASAVRELIDTIRQGLAPRSVRLFAAQGLLPVSREDLIRVLAVLAADGDDEISQAAQQTLAGFSSENLLAVLEAPDLDPLDIDLLCRATRDEALWHAIVRHPQTAGETLRWLARTAPPSTQDAVITNQVRIMGCLEILGDLRANPHVTPDVLRRVREFEEEFLERAVKWATAAEAEPEIESGPSIEDALAALKELGMRLLGGELEPVETLEDLDDGAPREVRDAFVRIALMNTYQRIMVALKGTREERLILARDRSLLVVRAVMLSPRLSEQEVEQLAGMRSINEECLRIISQRGRWLRRYGVVKNMVFNPRTPPGVAMQLMGRLSQRDLATLSRDRNVSSVVRRVAIERFSSRR